MVNPKFSFLLLFVGLHKRHSTAAQQLRGKTREKTLSERLRDGKPIKDPLAAAHTHTPTHTSKEELRRLFSSAVCVCVRGGHHFCVEVGVSARGCLRVRLHSSRMDVRCECATFLDPVADVILSPFSFSLPFCFRTCGVFLSGPSSLHWGYCRVIAPPRALQRRPPPAPAPATAASLHYNTESLLRLWRERWRPSVLPSL